MLPFMVMFKQFSMGTVECLINTKKSGDKHLVFMSVRKGCCNDGRNFEIGTIYVVLFIFRKPGKGKEVDRRYES